MGAAFDVRRGRLVLFGGYQPGSGELGQTWEWDEDRWSRVAVPGPSARNGPAMAYDKRRGVVVLFGGDRAGLELGDTWTWDGSAWRRVASAGPSPRSLARAEYDPGLGRIVLFGGIADDVVLSDAWEWDGTSWTLLAANAPQRFLHGFAGDPRAHRLVTFGGAASAAPSANGETWVLDRATWSPREALGPEPRDHVALALDAARRKTVLYGGIAGGQPRDDTWEWDGEAWTLVADHGAPGPRANPVLAFDPARHRILMYGGFDPAGPKNDLWSWDGKSWRPVAGS